MHLLSSLRAFCFVTIGALTLSGCASTPAIEWRDAAYEARDVRGTWRQLSPRQSDELIWVSNSSILTSADIERATHGQSDDGQPAVRVELTEAAARRLQFHTGQRIGQPLALFLDGEFVAASKIVSPANQQLIIEGIDAHDAERIVRAFVARQPRPKKSQPAPAPPPAPAGPTKIRATEIR